MGGEAENDDAGHEPQHLTGHKPNCCFHIESVGTGIGRLRAGLRPARYQERLVVPPDPTVTLHHLTGGGEIITRRGGCGEPFIVDLSDVSGGIPGCHD
jgi:hypothetical protein